MRWLRRRHRHDFHVVRSPDDLIPDGIARSVATLHRCSCGEERWINVKWTAV